MIQKIKLLLITISITVVLGSAHNNDVKVIYEREESTMKIGDLMDLLDIYNVNVKMVNKDFPEKEILIEEVLCKDGKFNRRILNSMIPIRIDKDTLSIEFISYAIENDSLIIKLKDPVSAIKYGVNIPTKNKLLIEYEGKSVYNQQDTIPVVVYSSGIPSEFIFMNQKAVSYNICGLRDSKILPSDFYKEYGILDYLYYNVIIKDK